MLICRVLLQIPRYHPELVLRQVQRPLALLQPVQEVLLVPVQLQPPVLLRVQRLLALHQPVQEVLLVPENIYRFVTVYCCLILHSHKSFLQS